MIITRAIESVQLEEKEVNIVRQFTNMLEGLCDELERCEECPFYKIDVCDPDRQYNMVNMVGELYNQDFIVEERK